MREQLEREMDQPGGVNFNEIAYFTPNLPQSIGQSVDSDVRMLPGWQGDESPYWHKERRHFHRVQLDDGRIMELPRICPKESVAPGAPPQPCPVCERQARAQAAGDKATASRLKVRSRFYVNVIDEANLESHWQKDDQGQVVIRSKVWGMSPGLMRKLTTLMGMRGRIYDRQTGRSLKIWATKTGKEKKDVRYDVIDSSESRPLPENLAGIQLMPLDRLDTIKSYQDLAREIAATYPDAPGAGAPPQAGMAQPPYANPYQPAPQPPQGWQGMPPGAQAPAGAPMGMVPPWPDQNTIRLPPTAPPQQAPVQAPAQPQAPPAAPPGWAMVDGQWVQTGAQGAPQQPPAPQQPQQAPVQAPGQAPGEDDIPF
jgi:hypothetical protein